MDRRHYRVLNLAFPSIIEFSIGINIERVTERVFKSIDSLYIFIRYVPRQRRKEMQHKSQPMDVHRRNPLLSSNTIPSWLRTKVYNYIVDSNLFRRLGKWCNRERCCLWSIWKTGGVYTFSPDNIHTWFYKSLRRYDPQQIFQYLIIHTLVCPILRVWG